MEQKPDLPRHCNFFVAKRKRFCRLIPAKGKRFCGEHLNHEIGSDGNADEAKTVLVRIPCPYDGHHTVARKQLEKHLKVCNSRPRDQPAFYQKGINAGTADNHEELEALRLASFTLDEVTSIITKVEETFADHVPSIETSILTHPALKPELSNHDNGVSARKHLLQLDSLLGHMTRLKLLSPATCFIELGAGRGRLSQWMQQAMEDLDNTSFLLIDRAAVRHKRDAFYQRDDGGPGYERINMDIEHLCVGKVPCVARQPDRPLVAYTKHLCGAATDLALRCLMETRRGNAPPPAKSPVTSTTQNTSTQSLDQQNDSDKTPPDTSSNKSADISSNTSALPSQSSNGGGVTILSDNHSNRTSDVADISEQTLRNDLPVLPPKEAPSEESKIPICDGKERHLASNPVKGIVMALCCHHRCSWKAYVGKTYFQDRGITQRQFMALVRMSSWATCGNRVTRGNQETQSPDGKTGGEGEDTNGDDVILDGNPVDDDSTHKEEERGGSGGDGDGAGGTLEAGKDGRKRKEKAEEEEEEESHECPAEQETITSVLGLSASERQEIGFRCKRVLDMGRVAYLQSLGLQAQLVYYVERSISPENAVLIATPIQQ